MPARGGTVSGTVDGSTVVVTVPAGDFADGVEVSIIDTSSTAPVPVGDSLVLAFAVNFCVGGSKVTGTFPVAVSVTVTNPAIAPGQRLSFRPLRASSRSLLLRSPPDPSPFRSRATRTSSLSQPQSRPRQ